MQRDLQLDFETQSHADLKKVGAWAYALHPTTEVLCAAYAWDDEEPQLWRNTDPLWKLIEVIESADRIVAHNAQFEMAIINGWMGLNVKPEIFDCTMARAYAKALPGKLELAAQACGYEGGKHAEGKRAMQFFNRPIKKTGMLPTPAEYPEKYEQLLEYCPQDVILAQFLDKKLPQLTYKERQVLLLDWEINQRGVELDMTACRTAIDICAHQRDEANARLAEITGGAATSVSQQKRVLDWAQSKGYPHGNLKAGTVRDFLKDTPDANVNLRRALITRAMAQKASVRKFEAMEAAGSLDGRARGLFQYHGTTTGRWAGRRIQLQNLPRPSKILGKPVMQRYLMDSLSRGEDITEPLEMLAPSVLSGLSSLVRGFLIPKKGCEFVGADLSNIEGRVLAWLAGQNDKVKAFAQFDKGDGKDIYLIAASRIYGADVSDDEDPRRMIGKVAELALGYRGSIGAFQSMAKIYGLVMDDAEAMAIVQAWRTANPRIKQAWYDTEAAAKEAIQAPGATTVAAKCKFMLWNGDLYCRLPSGRNLCYPAARLVEGDYGLKIAFGGHPKVGPSRNTNVWGTVDTYGGKLIENITQAVARDVLAEAALRINPEFPIVLHVHDELVSEVPIFAVSAKEYAALMAQPPAWAEDLPLAAKGFVSERYGK